MTRLSKRPPINVPILSSDSFSKEKEELCLLGWFRKTFCHEDEASHDAEEENPIDETACPVILSWVPVYHHGFSLRRKYKSWRANALQALIKECKRIDKHSRYPAFHGKEKYIDPKTIVSFNDDLGRKKETLAKVWNRTMAKLGYVKGNPEA